MQRLAGAVLLAIVAGVVMYSMHVDRQYEVMAARAAWEEAATLNRPSATAQTLLCRIERHKDTIIADGIASADSFQAVQSRLDMLWEAYCWLEDERLAASPAAGGEVTLGNE
ncbi:MAG: hypothetical protein HYT31_03730 [Parcubacteria group bacterium]|nr:hypothetical protein [Parcubacteria group bacterium]